MSQLVTMCKTWLYHYEPEIKQQSIDWGQKFARKVLVCLDFWDEDGFLLIDYL